MNKEEINELTPPYQPLHDYVLCKLVPIKKDTLIATAGSDPRRDAMVIAVGPGRVTDQAGPDGQLLLNKPTVKVGDIVVIHPQQQHVFTFHGHDYVLCNHFQIFMTENKEVCEWLEAHPSKSALQDKPNIMPANMGMMPPPPHQRRRN